MSKKKGTAIIDYRPKKGVSAAQVMNDVHKFMTTFPSIAVEGVSIRTASVNNEELGKLMVSDHYQDLKFRIIYEHTQITFMRLPDARN